MDDQLRSGEYGITDILTMLVTTGSVREVHHDLKHGIPAAAPATRAVGICATRICYEKTDTSKRIITRLCRHWALTLVE